MIKEIQKIKNREINREREREKREEQTTKLILAAWICFSTAMKPAGVEVRFTNRSEAMRTFVTQSGVLLSGREERE